LPFEFKTRRPAKAPMANDKAQNSKEIQNLKFEI
jgi:hypothetical protein